MADALIDLLNSPFGFNALLLILLSPAIGSFVALLADRLPRGEDVVRRRSFCRNCDQRLGPFDLVPILSFVRRYGRCAHCGAAIPPALLFTELLCFGAAVLVVVAPSATLASPVTLWLTAVALWCLIGLSLADLTHYRLPDLLTGSLFVVAALRAGLAGGHSPVPTLAGALIGAAAGVLVFWVIRHIYFRLRGAEGLGLGDVKLMAGIGAFNGWQALPVTLLMAALLALALAFWRSWKHATPLSATTKIPFGTTLCTATAVVWFTLSS